MEREDHIFWGEKKKNRERGRKRERQIASLCKSSYLKVRCWAKRLEGSDQPKESFLKLKTLHVINNWKWKMCQRKNNPETSTLDYQLDGVKKGNKRKKKNHMEKRELLSRRLSNLERFNLLHGLGTFSLHNFLADTKSPDFIWMFHIVCDKTINALTGKCQEKKDCLSLVKEQKS